MRPELASLSHCAVPFLSRAAANLFWYCYIFTLLYFALTNVLLRLTQLWLRRMITMRKDSPIIEGIETYNHIVVITVMLGEKQKVPLLQLAYLFYVCAQCLNARSNVKLCGSSKV